MADPIMPVPNEDKKPPAQQKTQPHADPPMAENNQEASAADLLSLWGSGSSKAAPKPVPVVAPKPMVPKPVAKVPIAPKPVAPAPTPVKQQPHATIPLQKTEPKGTPAPLFTAIPRPTPTTTPPAKLPPIPPPRPSVTENKPVAPTQANPPKPKEPKPAGQVSWGDIISPKVSQPSQQPADLPQKKEPPREEPRPLFSPVEPKLAPPPEKKKENFVKEEKELEEIAELEPAVSKSPQVGIRGASGFPTEGDQRKGAPATLRRGDTGGKSESFLVAPYKEKEEEPEDTPKEKPKPEVIEGELVGEVKSKPEKSEAKEENAGLEFVDEEDSFAVKLEEFLHEFNLKPAHIFYAIGGFVAVIILIFGGIWGFKYFTASGGKKIPVPVRPATVILREETGVPSTADIGETIAFTSGMVGSSGMLSTIRIGTETESRIPLVSYLVLFGRLNNAYTTNLDELLNKSTDRKARLAGYLSLLRSLDAESTKAVENIKKEMADIQTQYDPYKKRQDEIDKNFFEQMDAYNGQTAEDLLYDFINVSEEMVSLQSRFKALNKVLSFFESALPKIKTRIHDIELNEDALLSGIKVYDVQGSNLQLIRPVEGQTTTGNSLNSPSVPFLPISPFQLNTGTDFITQPGGGFVNFVGTSSTK